MSLEPAGSGELFREGEHVLLIQEEGQHLRQLSAGGHYHFHEGTVAFDDIIGEPEGTRVETSTGKTLTVVRPTAVEWIRQGGEPTQTVRPRDQAMLVTYLDLRPGLTVAEAGAGAGMLTITLLRHVGESGRVISVEKRSDHAEAARQQVTDVYGEEPDRWDLQVGDAANCLGDLTVDRLVLDLPDPWSVLEAARGSLKPGGLLGAYLPTVGQISQLRAALDGPGWEHRETFETLKRRWHVTEASVRPEHRMLGHTGFLTIARYFPAPRS